MSPGYDPAQRAAAAAIQRDHRYWLIMYGPHSRMLYAFPLFLAPPGTFLAAPSPPALLAGMRRAELAAGHVPAPARRRPPGRPPPPAPPA